MTTNHSDTSKPDTKEAMELQIKAAFLVYEQTKKPLDKIRSDLMAHVEAYAEERVREAEKDWYFKGYEDGRTTHAAEVLAQQGSNKNGRSNNGTPTS